MIRIVLCHFELKPWASETAAESVYGRYSHQPATKLQSATLYIYIPINIWYFGGQLKNLLSLDLIVQQCYGDLHKWLFRLSANLPNQDVIKKTNEIIFKIVLNAFHQAVSPLSCLILIMFHKIAVKKHLQISGVITLHWRKMCGEIQH